MSLARAPSSPRVSRGKRGALAAVLLLAGCATVPVPIDREHANASWALRRPQLEQIDHFTLQARASAGGALSGSANLLWRQHPQDFDLHVSGPFGVGALSLAGNERRVRVRSKEQDFVTDDPERTLRENLGWTLPITRLRWWVLGLPAPNSSVTIDLDSAGHVTTLTQDGWVLNYDAYQPVGSLDLPRRMLLSREDLRIRVAIDAWSDLPPP